MADFVLAFPYKGFHPGDVICVDEDIVPELIKAGVGHLKNGDVKLSLGRLPEPVVPAADDSDTKAPRRTKKAPVEQEPLEHPES